MPLISSTLASSSVQWLTKFAVIPIASVPNEKKSKQKDLRADAILSALLSYFPGTSPIFFSLKSQLN